MKRSTLIALAAAVLSAKMAGAVGFTGEEFERLEIIVEDQNVPAIRDFANQKNDLDASDPLGALLLSIADHHVDPSAEAVDVVWNVRKTPRRFRPSNRGWSVAWHWRPSHRVIRGLYGKPKHRPHIY